MVLADQDSWDRYAAAHWLNLRRWLDDNPDDELAEELRRELTEDPRRHVRYRREHLGWASSHSSGADRWGRSRRRPLKGPAPFGRLGRARRSAERRGRHGGRRGLTASGLHPVLLLAPDPAEQERCAAYLAGARVTGALVLSPHDGHPLPGLLRRAGVPTVLSGRPADSDAGLAYVDVDNRAAAERAVRWLRERGRRTVAAVAGPQDMAAARERLAGYRAAMGAELRPALVEIADFTRTGGRRATARLLAREPGIDAVFAASDQMALGALQAVRDAGRGAPEVAVIGFDDVRHVAGDAEPALTTVHQPSAEMGRALARLLLAGRGGADALVFPTRLVVRGSA